MNIFQAGIANCFKAPPGGLPGFGDGAGTQEIPGCTRTCLQPCQKQEQVHDEYCWQTCNCSSQLQVLKRVPLSKLSTYPILNYRGATRPGVSAPKSRVPPALNRVPATTGRASIAAGGRPLNDRTNRYNHTLLHFQSD